MMIDWWIIEKSIEDRLAAEDEKRLQAWLQESPEHARFYERVKQAREQGLPAGDFIQWREMFIRELETRKRRRTVRRLRTWGWVAAVLVLGIAGGWWAWQTQQVVEAPQPVRLVYQEPDRNRVHLITATGEVLNFSSATEADTLRIDGKAVIRHEKGLVYGTQDSCATQDTTERMNEIYIPRGAEFNLVLGDGSHIWLNSDSRLRYPSSFYGTERHVELSGEAFFEISRNEEMPFVVRANGVEVTVLGTEFNVNARSEEDIQTTLVTGKVEVNLADKSSVSLKPGEMASANVPGGTMKAEKVNVQRYIAWRYGRFSFENATMEEMMDELSLWYDVTVEFQNEHLKGERFTGSLQRSESIMDILKKIERTTYAHFEMRGNQIIVGD